MPNKWWRKGVPNNKIIEIGDLLASINLLQEREINGIQNKKANNGLNWDIVDVNIGTIEIREKRTEKQIKVDKIDFK